MTIQLSRQEIEYLTDAGFLSQVELDVIGSAEWLSTSSATLTLSRDMAERFRDFFTEQLAKVGFDQDYELTCEGQMLEVLIDRFYAGCFLR